MNILHVIPFLRSEEGGPVRAVIDLSEAMSRRGHGVGVLTFDDRDAPAEWNHGDAPTTRVVRMGPGRTLGMASRGSAEASVEWADVVHFHGIWVPVYLQLWRICRRLRRPHVISVRGMLDDWSMRQSVLKKRAFLAVGGRRWLEDASAVHLTAEAELAQASRYFPRERGQVIPNLLNLEPFEQSPDPTAARETFEPLRRGEPTVLFLSRVHPKKGVEHLVDAAAQLRDGGLPVQVIIAGTGDAAYTAAIQRRIEANNLGDRVHMVGQVTGDLKVSLYAACDLFCLPTSQENFGFVFFESLAAGTAVITTRGVDTWPELEASGGTVIVPETGEGMAVRIASAITGVLSEEGRSAAIGRTGRSWMFENMRPDQIAARFEAFYGRAAGAPAGAGR